jgi:hypothetical protein
MIGKHGNFGSNVARAISILFVLIAHKFVCRLNWAFQALEDIFVFN